MIFSKLFKAKWQHKDSNIRIAAINDELNSNDNDDKEILNTLLQEDDNELVRRSVLLKFNDFNHWVAASNENTHKKVREYAQKQVEEILLGQNSLTLSVAEKRDFIEHYDKVALLETLLKAEQDDDLIITLYNKLAKPQLIIPLFKSKTSELVQLFLLTQVESQELLEKLLKHSSNSKVTCVIEDKIAVLVAAELKPLKIKKQVQLLLSKLLALKDVVQYQEVVNKKASLVEEWQLIQTELSCLTEEEKQNFLDKYQSIEAQLEKVFVKKAETYQQQQIENKLAQDKLLDKEKFSLALKEYAHSITSAIFEDNGIDEKLYTGQLEQITEEIKGSALNTSEQKVFLIDVEKLQVKLTKLPEIAQSITEATHLVSKISQVALPMNIEELSERSQLYNDWLAQWKQLDKKASGILPESIVNAHKEVVSQWTAALKPLFREQAQRLNGVRKKLADVKRLIAQGKYNAAFGVFNKVTHAYQLLSEEQQDKISRDYNTAKEKMAELSDWENYIATPRKQKLLEQVNILVINPLDNPNEQASKVKAFRKTWNSLGHADDEVEKSLNNEFNLACEKAFAPCRLYFSEQEKLRELHLVTRTKLIESAKALSEKVNDEQVVFKAIDGELNKLQQQWRDAGEVDREKYKILNVEFSTLLKPVKTKIASFHQNNHDKKQRLIEKALELSKLDDVNQATQDVKALQRQWKEIGYCGKQAENGLWQKFRAINDEVFEKRKVHQTNVQAKQADLQNSLAEQLEELVKQKETADSVPSIERIIEKVVVVKSQAEQENIRSKTLFNSIAVLITELQNAITLVKTTAENKKWQNIFLCFENMSDSIQNVETSAPFEELPATWKKQIIEVLAKESLTDRTSKTLELEIIAGVASPIELKEQRMAVQVTLMKEQMSSGHRTTIEQALVEWLSMGSLSTQDKEYIARIKPIYCQ